LQIFLPFLFAVWPPKIGGNKREKGFKMGEKKKEKIFLQIKRFVPPPEGSKRMRGMQFPGIPGA